MAIKYYVCGLGYNQDLEVTDYGIGFGRFDTYTEAYELFVKLQCRSVESFFVNAPKVYELDLRVEECEVTEESIECIRIINEWGVINPNFKEESKMNIKQIAYEKYQLDWMLRHGYTLTQLIGELSVCMEEANDDLETVFDVWEFDYGFGSEIWVCFDEFIVNEYQDKHYMKQLLTKAEYDEYRKEVE